MPRITAQEIYQLCEESLPWAGIMGFEITEHRHGHLPGAVIADCRLLKLGKRLAYGEVSLFTEGDEESGPVAHVTATYSIPPERDGG